MTRKRFLTRHNPFHLMAMSVALGLGVTACADTVEPAAEPDEAPVAMESIAQPHITAPDGTTIAIPELHPSIGARCLQIDRRDPSSPTDPGDANLVLGNDGNSDSYFQPADCSSVAGDFIDWDELDFDGALDITQFQLKDVISVSGTKDPSSFPFSDNRVGAANVVPKQDLVEAAIAFNSVGGTVEDAFVNVGLTRLGTEGSSSWFGIFTRNPSHIHGADQRLTFDIRRDDILIVGDFDPSKGDIVAVHLAAIDADGLSAVEVASPDGLAPGGVRIWGPRLVDSDIVGALNTTTTPLGAAGHLFDGTDARGASIPHNRITRDGQYNPGAFFETAIPLSIFTGGGVCGNVFHGNFITRPSRSRTSDLKDLLGPFILNLGALDPNPALTPTCEGDLAFEAEPVISGLPGAEPGPVPNPVCTWTIVCDGVTVLEDHVNDCSSTTVSQANPTNGLFPLGSDDAAVSCEATVSVESSSAPGCLGEGGALASVFAPLEVTVTATPRCEDPGVTGMVSSFAYAVDEVSGGSGNYSYAWSFAGTTGSPQDSVTGDATSTATSGDVYVDVAGASEIYTARLVVTDPDLDAATGQSCSAQAQARAIPLAPLSVALALSAEPFACTDDLGGTTPEDFDAARYTASVSGGTGLYTYDWTPDDFCTDIGAPGTIASSDSCVIDPDNATQVCGSLTIYATVASLALDDGLDDLRATCPAAQTNLGHYAKQTIIDASVD